MKKIERFSVNKINKCSKNREVWCWGCGFQYGRMIKTYINEPFVQRICGLVDSNKKMQGNAREIGDRTVSIYGPEELIKYKEKKYLLIISSDAYQEIYKNAQVIFKELDIMYTIYPRSYYGINNTCRDIFCKLPLKRQLLFYVGSNRSQPHDNSDEIVRYLQEEYKGKKYKVIYLTDYPCEVPVGVKQISVSEVRNKSTIFKVMKYYYFYATSKYIFYESGSTGRLRKDQVTFYLNHGTIPLKYVKDALKQPSSLNYAICPGPGCVPFYEEQYSVDKSKLLYIMPPRVKRIFEDKSKMIDELFQTRGEQIILWLPTFRKLERGDKSERRDSTVESPVFELLHSDEIKLINKQLKDNHQKLVIKCHPREKDDLMTGEKFSNVIITTDKQLERENMATHFLMNRADSLISDYSGITFEYMLLDKPLGYYIPDIQEYSRGFAVENPLDYMPGNKMNRIEDLMSFLVDIKEKKDNYAEERRMLVHALFGDVNPHQGAEKLVEFLDSEN